MYKPLQYRILQKYHLLCILLLYGMVYLLLYPAYKYIFDLDAVGYLSITKHLAEGDYANGINGFWPPLHSWLAIPFYKAGMNEFAAFKTVSGLTGAGILIVMNRLLVKTNIAYPLRMISLLVCIPVILSYAFYELAADVLLCLLLLVYTDIITEKNFFQDPIKNCAAGLTGCLCYFAKTYALPFFFLHFIILQWVLYKRSAQQARRKMLTQNLLLGISSFIIPAIPWIFILYSRFHVFTLGHVFVFGRSGQFNFSWYFNAAQQAPPQLIGGPPDGLCCYWENPLFYLLQQPQYYGRLFTFSMIQEQIRTLLYNITVALKCLHEFSFLGAAIIVALVLYLLQKKDHFLRLLLLMILIFPLGYLLLHVEDRFLWAINLLVLLAGLVLGTVALRWIPVKKPVQYLFWCLFFASFLITPIDNLKDWRGKDAAIFELAAELKTLGVKGKFLSENYNDVIRLAYLTGNTYYQTGLPSYHYEDLLAASRRQGIDYFFYYYKTLQELEAFKQTVYYKSASQEVNTKMPNLLLLKLK